MVNLIQSDQKKTSFRVTKKSKAWTPAIKKLSAQQSYFFKGRLGKRSNNKPLVGSKINRGRRFFLQNSEAGGLTTAQMEVLWRSFRRRTRRFNVNLRRPTVSSRLQLTATASQSRRKKGGRMGSGKSPLVGFTSLLRSGSFFFVGAELRQKPLNTFLAFRSILKKISLKSTVKYVF
jgi:hypothetical protein